MTFSSVPEEKFFLTNKCDEFRKTITEFYQHQNYKVVDVVTDLDKFPINVDVIKRRMLTSEMNTGTR